MEKDVELSIKRLMAEELKNGVSLSDIQKLVNERFKQKLTYMEIRILASELDSVDWKALDPRAQAEEAKKAKQETGARSAAEADGGNGAEQETAAADQAPGSTGGTVVELSKLARPGMMLSGTVRFASGSTAEWYVDQMGRLGLENLKGEKPTPEDIDAFQIELEKVARKAMGR